MKNCKNSDIIVFLWYCFHIKLFWEGFFMRFKKLRHSLFLMAGVGILLSPGIQVDAAAKVQTWDLVDSGKHLDYDGNSVYMSQVKTAAGKWNAYKSGVIRPDSAKVIEDVFCADYSANDGINATTYSYGSIKFNKKVLGPKVDSRKLNVAIHELGHALGLDHNTSSDIMYKYDTTKTTLSANDKASYDAAYKKY